MKKSVLILSMVLALVLTFVNCNKEDTKTYCSVTYSANGGIGTIPNVQTVEKGKSVTLPSGRGMNKSGFVFAGWNTKANGTGTNYNAESSYVVYGNITLYAKWNSTYTVIFDKNGGEGTTPNNQTVEEGKSITLPTGNGMNKTGFVFGGWNTKTNGTGTNYDAESSYVVNSNITLYAKWNSTYTVMFDKNGGEGTTPNSQTVEKGKSISLPSGSGMSKSGFAFGGWNIKADGTGTNYNAGSSYIVNSDITLYVKWVIPCTVTLDKNGGVGGTNSVQAIYDHPMPSAATAPTKNSYTFDGYFDAQTGGRQYYKSDMSSAKKWDKTGTTATLYAQWISTPTYTTTITFDKNGGTGGTNSVQATYEQAMPSGGTPPTRSGYIFNGYYAALQLGKKYYDSNMNSVDKWDKTESTATLYALWTSQNQNCPSTISDVSGNSYSTVEIGTQCWMKENLKTTKYSDDTNIPNILLNDKWYNTYDGAYCYYSNSSSNASAYGALYNWYAVNTSKLCPTGWHVPTSSEYNTLASYLGDSNIAGGKMKTTGTTYWNSPNTGASNSSNFSARGGGYREPNGTFRNLKNWGVFWTSSTGSDGYVLNRVCWSYNEILGSAGYLEYNGLPMETGASVRCVKNSSKDTPPKIIPIDERVKKEPMPQNSVKQIN